jgi:hypothetical protein
MSRKVNVCIQGGPPVQQEVDDSVILEPGRLVMIGRNTDREAIYEIVDVNRNPSGVQVELCAI